MPRENFIGSGAECRVYAVSSELVMKTYRLKGERDRAMERQQRAHGAGFAPPTFGVCKDHSRHGYISARVDTETELCDGQIDWLIDQMDLLGLDSCDVREANAGLYKGAPVVIDFGDLSADDPGCYTYTPGPT